LLLAGWLAWLMQQRSQERDKQAAARARLAQVEAQLSKNASSAQKKTTGKANTSGSAANTVAGCTVSKDLKDNIAAAVQSQNYAALAGYMTNPVQLVIAASEKGGDETPAQAVDDMRYLNGTTNPWDFNLSPGVTGVWAAHFYGQYFTPQFYAGQAASDEVVSFQFANCTKIKSVFMAADFRILETN
jgi:hypothetical protein